MTVIIALSKRNESSSGEKLSAESNLVSVEVAIRLRFAQDKSLDELGT
jgi:hypothetical protein